METHARFLLIGIFSLVVTLLLIVFVLWLGKLQLDREYQEYDVRFQESVTGLTVGGIVQYHGIQVGETRKLSLDPNDPREVIVRIRVAADTPIKTDTKAQLSYTGLTGVAVVELFGGSPDAELLRDADPAEVPRIATEPSTLSQLVTGSSGAMRSAEEVLVRIGEVLSDENVARVSELLSNLDAVSASVKEDYPSFREAMSEARDLEHRLGSALRRADELLAQMQQDFGAQGEGRDASLFLEVRAAVADIRAAAKALEQVSSRGERTISGIDAQARTDLVATLQALRQASDNLARITQRFEQQPADFLLGRDDLPVYDPEAKP